MKVTVIKIKHYQLKNNFKKSYLKDIISNLKKFDTSKIQLTIAYNFISSLDNDEEYVLHSKSDNTEILMNEKADDITEELFDSLKNQRMVASLSLIMFIYCIINIVKQIRIAVNHI